MLYEKYFDEVIRFAEENRDNLVADIKRLVDVPSVEGEPLPGKPFGEGPANALAEVLKMADEIGVDTCNCENYMGYAEIKGESDKQIATITHVDVVPAGNGWTGGPFDMRVKDGWVIGRGVIDDKGPAVCCLYALKFLKEHNIHLKHTYRALMGANEETNMGDVEYYLKNYKAPDFCFTPDAFFPVCNGEKGYYGASLVSRKLEGNILEFEGGVADNVIPDRAHAVIKGTFENLPSKEGIELSEKDGNLLITGFGKGGHASFPAGTVNAIALIVNYILDNNLCSENEREALEFLRKLHSNTDGSGVGINAKDDVFDPLTIVGSVISFKDGCLKQNFDCRYPTSITDEKITESLKKFAGKNWSLENACINKPFYISADEPVIKALMQTFNDVTGRDEKPFAMGGATYARHFPLAVSFGPEYMDAHHPDFVGSYHAADEGANIQDLVDGVKMYTLAVLKLQDVEF